MRKVRVMCPATAGLAMSKINGMCPATAGFAMSKVNGMCPATTGFCSLLSDIQHPDSPPLYFHVSHFPIGPDHYFSFPLFMVPNGHIPFNPSIQLAYSLSWITSVSTWT